MKAGVKIKVISRKSKRAMQSEKEMKEQGKADVESCAMTSQLCDTELSR